MKLILLPFLAALLSGTAFSPPSTFTVTTNADSGPGSFRQAILDSNASVGVKDTIEFNIPAPPSRRVEIVLASALPVIIDPVAIFGDYNDGIQIVLNGAAVPAPDAVLTVAAGDCSIRFLAIVDGNDAGIRIHTNGGNQVDSCLIGTITKIGSLAKGSRRGNAGPGIDVVSGARNVLLFNVIAFNGGSGIVVRSGATRVEYSNSLIYSNGGIPVDLGGDGRTPNDVGDVDAGANTLLNCPMLEKIEVVKATSDYRDLKVWGRLEAAPATSYSIRFFVGLPGPIPGDFEILDYQTSESQVMTDASGLATFIGVVRYEGNLQDVSVAVATTYFDGTMSELSVPIAVDDVAAKAGCGACGLEWLIVPALAWIRRRSRRATSGP